MRRVGRPRKRPAADQRGGGSAERARERVEESVDVRSVESHPEPQVAQPQMPAPQPQPSVEQPQVHGFENVTTQPRESRNTIERAKKLGVENFDGSNAPDSAISWWDNVEDVLGVMGCTEAEKMTITTFLLKDRAKDWWKALQRRNPEGVSWEKLKKEFFDKYYPKAYKDTKIEEFLRLEQGPMTVTAYEKKFSELGRVCPFILDDEEQKCRQFKTGLRPEIRNYVAATKFTEYGELVEAAIQVEQSVRDTYKHDQRKQRQGGQSWSMGNADGKMQRTGGKFSGQSSGFKQNFKGNSSWGSMRPPSGQLGNRPFPS